MLNDEKITPENAAALMAELEKLHKQSLLINSQHNLVKAIEIATHYLERAEKAEAAMQWQTMDSAPKDGTPILVFLRTAILGSRIHVARLRNNVSTVAGVFAFDAPEMLMWTHPPTPPTQGEKS